MKTTTQTLLSAIALLGCVSCGFADEPVTSAPDGAAEVAEDLVTDAPDDREIPDGRAVDVDLNLELAPPAAIEWTDQTPRTPIETTDDAPGATTVAFAQTTEWDVEAEREFLDLINAERRSRGLGELAVYWDLQDDARSHTKTMETTNDLHHNPNLQSVTRSGYWSKLGENVGRGYGVQGLHDAFMNSPGHRANVLGDYTHVGIGVRTPGTRWVTVVFMRAAVDGLERTYGPFHDDDFSPFEGAIHKIWKAGLTYGCGGQRYCPNDVVTRGQMAAFLTRALSLSPTGRDYFDDDAGAFYENSANAMYESGITVGCGDRKYCGSRPLKRGEMAVFLDRAFQYPSNGADYFSDDDGRFYEQSANDLKTAGITNGCGGSKFCGEDALTRGQMAAFLARALGL